MKCLQSGQGIALLVLFTFFEQTLQESMYGSLGFSGGTKLMVRSLFVCLVVSRELKERVSICDGVIVLKGKISLLHLKQFQVQVFTVPIV